MSAAAALLRDHLLHRQSKGETHVLLRPGVFGRAAEPKRPEAKRPEPKVEAPAAAREVLERPSPPVPTRVSQLTPTGSTNADKIASLAAMAETGAMAAARAVPVAERRKLRRECGTPFFM